MPNYRIYYAEREVADRPTEGPLGNIPPYRSTRRTDYVRETEWEEEFEGRDAGEALDAFFREHIRDNSELMWLDESGDSHPVEGLSYDPDMTYIWIENGKLMEYQGLDEATPGMVSCPLCEGAGEVTVEVADEYLGEYGEEAAEGESSEERITWG